jgi:signal peptidase I
LDRQQPSPATRSADQEKLTPAERVRSALDTLVFLVIVAGVALAVFLWGPKASVVVSHSMSPTFDIGDVIFVIPWRDPGVGDIAQFRAPLAKGHEETTIPIAHRIIGEDDRGFITKGDNPGANPDYWRVHPEQIDGEVLFWFPQIWVFRVAAALIGLAILVILWPAAIKEDETERMDPDPSQADLVER